MANQQIKKSTLTLTSLVVTLLIVMAVFFGGYTYLSDSMDNANIDIDPKYNDTYNELEDSQNELEGNVNDIKENFADVRAADSTWEVAWNGLLGLGNLLKLPINFVDTSESTFQAMVYSTDVVPPKFQTLAYIGILAVVVLLVLANLKGEPKT